MPDTLAGWEQMCEDIFANGQEEYENKCNEAKRVAGEQFDKEREAMREKMIAQLEANLSNQMVDTPDGPKHLEGDEYQKQWNDGVRAIDDKISRKRKEQLDMSCAMIEQPNTLEQIHKTYEFGKPQEQPVEQETVNTQGFSYDAMYQTSDGRIYSVADRAFINTRSVPENVIKVNCSGEEFKKGVLEWYRDNGFPNVRIAPELLTLEEYKIELLEMTDKQTSERIVAGFEYTVNGTEYHFNFDDNDQKNFSSLATTAQALIIANDTESTIKWQGWPSSVKTADTQPVVFEFTPADFLEFYTTGAMKHLNDCIYAGRTLKEEIRNCSTKEELQAIENTIA